MDLLPTGTVTFLFTDIVGSTNLARDYSDLWPTIQVRHHNLLQTAISTHHGYVYQIIGDEFQAAFATAPDALAAALAAQYALRAEDWGDIGSMHVRMGLHTGPATARAGKYEGYLTLSHAKRLMSVANGDQILLSEATEAVLGESLPYDITLRDLGKQRLKDFERGEQIYQVVARDLPAEFPPLKSLSTPPNNLPVQLTSFVGRSGELREVKQALSTGRLLTLTGPGGSGKTRLALQVAADMIEHFPDGVFFVALASITEPGLVPLTIAQSFSITEFPGRSMMDSLKDYLQNKTLLLLLDNFEQVILAATLVAELLMRCKDIKIMVTSHEGLHLSGEREYPVPPLELADPTQLPSLESLTQYSAAELFLQRAKAVKPDICITNDTAPVIAEICYRLDGLPLAIELAAARSKLLPPRAMLERMEHRLEFLTEGARDLPKRQQTLRKAIAWSYDLLDENEQRLFQRLSVFVDGWTINAAEAVAGDHPAQTSTLDQLGSLLDKSLLQEVEDADNKPRFVMLETLREFGLEQLAASGEEDMIRHHHASFYLALAEHTVASLENVEQVQWMNRMEQEHDNLLAALEWSRTAKATPEGAPSDVAEICLRLAGALGIFWEARGYYSEGRERLAAILLTDAAQGRTAARAMLLARSAELAYRQSDFVATTNFASESLAIYREVGHRQGMASALVKLGNAAMELGNYVTASKYLEEALMIWRKSEDKHGTARALISLAWVALRSGSYPLAKARLERALALSRELGDTRSIGFELAGLGEVALRQGNYRHATRLVEESLEVRKALGNKWGIGVSLGILGWIAMREENWDRAMVLLGESLEVRQEIGDLSGSAWCLERLAAVVEARGQTEKAVRLLGAGSGLRASIRSVIDPSDTPAYESKIRSLRARLGKERFAATWDEGRALTLEQAVDYALER
jgi:predicted ATPase/class 3 adenylate cyclase